MIITIERVCLTIRKKMFNYEGSFELTKKKLLNASMEQIMTIRQCKTKYIIIIILKEILFCMCMSIYLMVTYVIVIDQFLRFVCSREA